MMRTHSSTHRLIEMTREAVGAVAARATVVLPVAAVEQHGPHLPIGTDTFICDHVAYEAAVVASTDEHPIVVAPIVAYGSSHHHRPFPGVLSLTSDTFMRVLRDLGESLVHSGFKRIFILNGHGGNDSAIGVVGQDISNQHDIVAGNASYWTLARGGLAGLLDRHGVSWFPGHAGAFETACIRALHSQLVDEGGVPGTPSVLGPRSGPLSNARINSHHEIAHIDGYTDIPTEGTREFGQECVRIVVQEVASVLREFAVAEITTP